MFTCREFDNGVFEQGWGVCASALQAMEAEVLKSARR
jgi:hypothetical protein